MYTASYSSTSRQRTPRRRKLTRWSIRVDLSPVPAPMTFYLIDTHGDEVSKKDTGLKKKERRCRSRVVSDLRSRVSRSHGLEVDRLGSGSLLLQATGCLMWCMPFSAGETSELHYGSRHAVTRRVVLIHGDSISVYSVLVWGFLGVGMTFVCECMWRREAAATNQRRPRNVVGIIWPGAWSWSLWLGLDQWTFSLGCCITDGVQTVQSQ